MSSKNKEPEFSLSSICLHSLHLVTQPPLTQRMLIQSSYILLVALLNFTAPLSRNGNLFTRQKISLPCGLQDREDLPSILLIFIFFQNTLQKNGIIRHDCVATKLDKLAHFISVVDRPILHRDISSVRAIDDCLGGKPHFNTL